MKRIKIYLEITDKSYTASDIADILERALCEAMVGYYTIRAEEI